MTLSPYSLEANYNYVFTVSVSSHDSSLAELNFSQPLRPLPDFWVSVANKKTGNEEIQNDPLKHYAR